ncbi:MAG: AzlC family ABC transporter permease [Lachnospiraceae bacterium]|nr:AzlC family ABC transporter permease [Lachnospiraceae bacterium]
MQRKLSVKEFKRGLLAGIPIALGYLSVSFTFGIMAVSCGLSWWQALVVSMTNVTSAGQLAGVQVMMLPGQYIPMLISQCTINVRYSFMSISLTQKVDPSFHGAKRAIAGFTVTDEIFGVASREEKLNFAFFEGLSALPYFGWALGTLGGALLGQVLPEQIMLALNMGLYAMFIAIVVPEMKKSKAVVMVVGIAVAISCIFKFVPGFKEVPAGIAISVSAIVASLVMAICKPVEEAENE